MSEQTSYWARFNQARQTRRRVLLATGGVAAGAVALGLAGCGGGSSTSSGNSASSGLLFTPVDNSAKATKGGALDIFQQADIAAFNSGNGGDAANSMNTYSRIVKYDVYKYPDKPLPTASADAAISWETSPDGMTWTYKVRPNFKFDPRPPTNNRAMTSADIAYSWKYFEATSAMGTSLANSLDPSAPVTSVTATDSSTFVVKLAFPFAALNGMWAFQRYMPIYPVEADGQYDVRNDMRGTAAWRLKNYQRSSQIEYMPNPDWYDASKMNFSSLTYHILPEYAAAMSQFRAGNLATYPVHQIDILQTKRDLPQLLMTPNTDYAPRQWLRFSYLPKSPFLDDRVRKATSMLLDRDLIIETMYSTKQFSDAGLQAPTRWMTAIPGYDDPFWLDPKDKKAFGENAKFYQFDPAAAKQLIKAAGYNNGIESVFSYTSNGYDSAYIQEAQIMHQMWEANGDFKLKVNTPDYRSEWRPKFHYNYDKHEGIAWGGVQAYPDVDGWLQSYWRSGQERTGHVGADGKPDARLDDLIAKQRSEGDIKKRTEILQDFQRYAAGTMYLLFGAGSSPGYQLAHPWLGNFAVFRTHALGSDGNEIFPKMWIDSTKKS